MSRLTDNGVLLQFGWADWRKTKRYRVAQMTREEWQDYERAVFDKTCNKEAEE